MKTLALQKIEERKQLSLSTIKYKAILMNKEKCTFGEFHKTREGIENEFKGYVRAFLDIQVITYEEYENIISEFKMAEIKLKAEI